MMRQKENFCFETTEKVDLVFLPGIAGILRYSDLVLCQSRTVVSFGVDNKDHAIMDLSGTSGISDVKTTDSVLSSKRQDCLGAFSDETVEHSMDRNERSGN